MDGEKSMEEQMRTLAYLCPQCKQSVVVEQSVFRLAAAPSRFPCLCGGSALLVEMEADHVDLTVPCLSCGQSHQVRCSAHAFLHEKALAFSCKATGLDCCYVGEQGTVFQAVRRLEEAALQRQRDGDQESIFLNEAVMTEVLGELKDIADRGGISCACGHQDYKVKIHYSSVELECAQCGARLRIPAATGEDLEDLCCQYHLLIGGRGET